MLFNSYQFIFLYLPIVFFGFFWIARSSKRMAALWLAVASIFFYGYWNPKFVSLLLASIVFNYGAGFWICHVRQAQKSKPLLTLAIVANLLLLGFFKYANFFIATANVASAQLSLLDIVLPLGISFFTFTQIAFLVDSHRGIARESNFIHYLLFVTWFPHLIAGPVLHHKQMMPQFASPETYRPNVESISVGLTLFALGLFKKVVLADQFALYANPVFSAVADGGQPMLLEAWIGALAYTLQLYFDFSGYSDMAIGLSRLFNIKLPLNFNSPYKAASIIDFWRRWHMTLSAFLRDYLYFSLGGNRKGPIRRYINLMLTMLLGGLWHGAGWNFVIWGGLHGIYLVVNNGWQKLTGDVRFTNGRLFRVFSVLLTFTCVVIAWVPFRSTNFDVTQTMLYGMAGLNGVSIPQILAFLGRVNSSFVLEGITPLTAMPVKEIVLWLPAGLLIVWLLPNTQQWLANFSPAWDSVTARSRLMWKPNRAMAVMIGTLFGFSLLFLNRVSEFLYFQF
jgi:alginate O-acetyltransferase complex protein AlgI